MKRTGIPLCQNIRVRSGRRRKCRSGRHPRTFSVRKWFKIRNGKECTTLDQEVKESTSERFDPGRTTSGSNSSRLPHVHKLLIFYIATVEPSNAAARQQQGGASFQKFVRKSKPIGEQYDAISRIAVFFPENIEPKIQTYPVVGREVIHHVTCNSWNAHSNNSLLLPRPL